ncbi:MAG: VPA1267 family protein [Pseudomonadota bacterium]|nr:VPA1267 family protein [Pseudomonadota bacterium]
MASGRQLAEENLERFAAWIASKTDEDYRGLASRGVLSRKEIARECGFAKSALDQNPRIKLALRELEEALRDKGVLPLAVDKSTTIVDEPRRREAGTRRALLDAERLRRLEQENASLKAENAELKSLLGKHAILREALAVSGRLPR